MPEILYMVGAGSTKALGRPARPVPAMFDFISTCAEYIDDEVVLTTLTQLEKYRPYPYVWHSPAATRLADALNQQRQRNGTTDHAVRQEFAQALRQRPSESIEALLDCADSNKENAPSRDADDAEERFRFAIRRIFTLIGWDVQWSPLVPFLNRQFALGDTYHTFVSFNYDLVLERGIQLVAEGRFDVARMYGFPIKWQATGDPLFANGGSGAVPVRPLRDSGVDNRFSVLKPHGSLNWLVPIKSHVHQSARDEWSLGKTVIVVLGESGVLQYLPYRSSAGYLLQGSEAVRLPDELSPEVEGATMGAEPVIVTPRGAKRPDRQFLRDVTEREEAAIRGADEVYVLGWSMPRNDADQECVIRSMIRRRARPLQQVTAVNFHAGPDYYARVQDVFGIERRNLRMHNEGFREFASNGCQPAEL
jgi:hypothetical protein